jgi:hypothetical protein
VRRCVFAAGSVPSALVVWSTVSWCFRQRLRLLVALSRHGSMRLSIALSATDLSPPSPGVLERHREPRVVRALPANLSAQGVDRPELRVQIAVSALLGISLGRSLEWFDEIRSVPREELVALVVDTLDAIIADGSDV